MNENKLGSIITKLRKEKDITQKDLANILHISDKSISRWECGTSQPSLEMMFQISRYFEISYNDLITARLSDSHENDDIVKHIIREFQLIGSKRGKIIKVCLLLLIILVVILSIAFVFTKTYNRFKVYRVYSESNEISTIYGSYIETNIRDILYLGDIKIKDIKIEDTDIISADLYIKENNEEIIIQNYSSLENVYFVVSQSYIEIDDLSEYFDSLYLHISITDKKGKVDEYIIDLEFVLDFTNNKIIYPNNFKTENLSNSAINIEGVDVEKTLLEDGYEEMTNGILTKKKDKYNIHYYVDLSYFKLVYEKNNLKYNINYHLKTNILEVTINDEEFVIVENYRYDVRNNQMECITGSCNDYKNILKLLKEKVLYLFE